MHIEQFIFLLCILAIVLLLMDFQQLCSNAKLQKNYVSSNSLYSLKLVKRSLSYEDFVLNLLIKVCIDHVDLCRCFVCWIIVYKCTYRIVLVCIYCWLTEYQEYKRSQIIVKCFLLRVSLKFRDSDLSIQHEICFLKCKNF